MQMRSMDEVYETFFDFSKKIALKVCHDFSLDYLRPEIFYVHVPQTFKACQHLASPQATFSC
jgi:hypothetical protein